MVHWVGFVRWLKSSDVKQWKANRPVVNDSRLDTPEKDASLVNRKDPFPIERLRMEGLSMSTQTVPAKQLSPVTKDISWGPPMIIGAIVKMKQPSARKKVLSFGRLQNDTTRMEFVPEARFSSSDNPTSQSPWWGTIVGRWVHGWKGSFSNHYRREWWKMRKFQRLTSNARSSLESESLQRWNSFNKYGKNGSQTPRSNVNSLQMIATERRESSQFVQWIWWNVDLLNRFSGDG